MIILEKELLDSCFVWWPEIFNQYNTLLACLLATYIIKCKNGRTCHLHVIYVSFGKYYFFL